MSSTPHSAAPFVKVRRDHSSETAEDYVEAISELIERDGTCRVTYLARHMGVSHVTVIRIVSRLESEGLLETEPYRPVRLTAKGERLAARSRRRHEIVLEFLLALGVPEKDARRDAEGIEHHAGNATLKGMREFVEAKQRGAE